MTGANGGGRQYDSSASGRCPDVSGLMRVMSHCKITMATSLQVEWYFFHVIRKHSAFLRFLAIRLDLVEHFFDIVAYFDSYKGILGDL
jgi:hypothetical protein